MWASARYSQVIRESDAVTGYDYRVVNLTDARGDPTQEILADGNLTTARRYLPQSGC